ncbi:MAG: hypothetical protein AAF197_07535, partial [Pseudomonadota bacterium]
MKKWLSEPLVHFFLAGGLIFLVNAWLSAENSSDRVIIISEADIASLRANWVRQWRRAPSQQEMAGLIELEVEQEILVREGLALDMDVGDEVVRNRMIQKMKFLLEEEVPEPNQSDLQAWFKNNQDKYQAPVRYSFAQYYLGRDYEPELLASSIVSLEQGLVPVESGESISLDVDQVNKTLDEIALTFGSQFAAELS